MLPDGNTVASPSGVNVCLSSLSTGFSLLGRVGSWSPATPQGDPIQSAVVHWRKGYKLQAWRRGCQETSAVPMTSNKVFQLVDYIDIAAAASSRVMDVLLYQRDALIVLLMWESCLQGIDCGKLRLADFFILEGSSAQLPLPEPFPVGSVLIIWPNGSKTVKGRRAEALTLKHTGSEAFSSLSRLTRYVRACSGMSVESYIFSPSLKNGCSFAASAFNSSSLGKRLHKHLVDGGLYQGQSSHGYRRGHMQEYAAEGMDPVAIGKLAQIKTLSIVERYLDVSGHEARNSQVQKRNFRAVDDTVLMMCYACEDAGGWGLKKWLGNASSVSPSWSQIVSQLQVVGNCLTFISSDISTAT